jgi:hypothetical protein
MPFIEDGALERIVESARQARSELSREGIGGSTFRRAGDVLEVGGTAGFLGFANARWGTNGQLALLGVPSELWVALLGLGASWFNFAGEYRRDAEMIGAGALAGYLSKLGTNYGTQMKAQSSGQEITGMSPAQLGGQQVGQAYGGRRYVVSEMP